MENILEIRGVSKSFGSTKVLNNVNLEIRKGEVLGLCGENGAGKSTMMNCVTGVLQKDSGEVIFDGKPVDFASARESVFAGISFVHQELALCQDLTVAENMWMWKMPAKGGIINHKELYEKTEEILKNFDVDFKATDIVGSLSVAQQQVAEISKALSLNAKLIILDEPTSSITDAEAEKLFKVLNKLRKEGIGIVYISHRMNEIFELCDRVCVLRDGSIVMTKETKNLTEDHIIKSMVGREISEFYPKKSENTEDSQEIMRVEHYTGTGFNDISFNVKKGEILGFSGLIGAGRSEVMKAICGIGGYQSGKVFFYGKEIRNKHYEDALKHKICYLTEDRKKNGIFLNMSVKDNIVISMLKKLTHYGILNDKEGNKIADNEIIEMGVKLSNRNQRIGSLSGGNQQKAMIGKWMAMKPELIIMDEPTRGIDVGAKRDIHFMLRELANQGTGVILISSEMPEVIGLSDKVIVMHEGNMMGMVTGKDITEDNLIMMASGHKRDR